MARQTNTRLREKVIYSVFVRNHTKDSILYTSDAADE